MSRAPLVKDRHARRALRAAEARPAEPEEAPNAVREITGSVLELEIALVDNDPSLNPRKLFDPVQLQELADSITSKGVIQPILVRQGLEPGRFRIVAGERRWRASKLAGVDRIPAVYRELDDLQALEIALIENVQRADLEIIEEARAYAEILAVRRRLDPGAGDYAAKEAIAQAANKTVRYVEQRLTFLKLPPRDQARLALPKTDPNRLTIEDARTQLAESEAAIAAREARKLPPDELLMLAEIADKVSPGRAPKAHGACKANWRIRDDSTAATLRRKGMIQWWTGYDDHLQAVQLMPEGSKAISENLSLFKSDRAAALELVRHKAKRWPSKIEDQQYATAWLCAPIAPHPDDQARADEQRANAEQQRRQAEHDVQAQREAREARERTLTEERAGGLGFLAAVRMFEDSCPGLTQGDFNAGFSALLEQCLVGGPWTLVVDPDNNGETYLHHAGGDHIKGVGPSLEARRRLIAIAINFAAGFQAYSGPPLATPWADDTDDLDQVDED